LKGKGVRRKDGTAGDHYYKVQIAVPRQVPEEVSRTIDKLEQAYAENPRVNLKVAL